MSNSFQLLPSILISLLLSLPPLLVWLVGLTLALQFHATQPRSVRLALWGFTILVLDTLIFGSLNAVMPVLLFRGGISASQIGLIISGVSGLGQFIRAAGYALIVAALLRSWRVNAGEGGAV